MKHVLLRLAAAIAIVVVTGGAGPGAVGSCSDATKTAAESDFCSGEYWAMCERWDEAVASMPDAPPDPPIPECRTTDSAMRIRAIETSCAIFQFSVCKPTDLQAEACVEAIYRRHAVSTPSDLPAECAFCGGI